MLFLLAWSSFAQAYDIDEIAAKSKLLPPDWQKRPAGPFVYAFLGHVNLFHGRLHWGRALIGDIELDAPEHAEAEQQPAVAYVRPHDIEIERASNGETALPVRIVHVLAVGPVCGWNSCARAASTTIRSRLISAGSGFGNCGS